MLPLTLLLHMFIGTTLAGVPVIAALVAGYATVPVLIGLAGAGYLAGFPVAYVIARKLA